MMMLIAWLWVPFVGALFACAAYLGLQLAAHLCDGIEPFEDGPKPGKPPTPWLIAGAGAIGAVVTAQGASLPQLAMAAIIVVALAGCWYSDVRVGIVPDYFTLIPLGVLLLIAVVIHDWQTIIAAVSITVPFASAAALSKGRGMGWGDVKLVALGGAALGLQIAVLAFSAACLLAVCVAVFRRRAREPIPFAPYLVGATALGLTLNIF
jgi:leader peptidase (prepilin peptidase)/N-methyltransferase